MSQVPKTSLKYSGVRFLLMARCYPGPSKKLATRPELCRVITGSSKTLMGRTAPAIGDLRTVVKHKTENTDVFCSNSIRTNYNLNMIILEEEVVP